MDRTYRETDEKQCCFHLNSHPTDTSRFCSLPSNKPADIFITHQPLIHLDRLKFGRLSILIFDFRNESQRHCQVYSQLKSIGRVRNQWSKYFLTSNPVTCKWTNFDAIRPQKCVIVKLRDQMSDLHIAALVPWKYWLMCKIRYKEDIIPIFKGERWGLS